MKYVGILGIYSAIMALWIYAVLDPNIDRAPLASFIAVAVMHVAVGAASRQWRMVAVVVLVPVIALPAGYPGYDYPDPLPLWVVAAGYIPLGALLVALGVLAGKWVERLRSSSKARID